MHKTCDICGAPAQFIANGTIAVCVDCLSAMEDPYIMTDVFDILELVCGDDDESDDTE